MKNNDLFQASRRRFLLQLGGLTVAGMLGPSLLTPRSANAAEVQELASKRILTGSHWGQSVPLLLMAVLLRPNRLSMINTRQK